MLIQRHKATTTYDEEELLQELGLLRPQMLLLLAWPLHPLLLPLDLAGDMVQQYFQPDSLCCMLPFKQVFEVSAIATWRLQRGRSTMLPAAGRYAPC